MTEKASPQPALRIVESNSLNRRLQRRRKAFRPAIIMVGHSEQRLHLLDVTTEGALGYAFHSPEPGTRCSLLLLDQRVEAEVIWSESRKFGLHFGTPISSELVEKLLIVG